MSGRNLSILIPRCIGNRNQAVLWNNAFPTEGLTLNVHKGFSINCTLVVDQVPCEAGAMMVAIDSEEVESK